MRPIEALHSHLVTARHSLAAALLLCALALPLHAAEEEPGGLAGWSPFAEAGLAVHMQRFDAAGSSSIGISSKDNKLLSVLTTRLGGGLRGPRWDALPGGPYPMLRGGIGLPLRTSSTLLGETQTFGVLPDQDQRSTDYSVKWGSFWELELGLQYRLPLEILEIRATPALAYLGTRLRYEAAFSVRTPPTIVPGGDPIPSMLFGVSGNASSTQHFVGPQLEIEVAFARVRRLQLSLFVEGRALWLLSENRERLDFSGDVDGSLETGSVRVDAGDLGGRIGFGLRGAFW